MLFDWSAANGQGTLKGTNANNSVQQASQCPFQKLLVDGFLKQGGLPEAPSTPSLCLSGAAS